MTLYQRLRNEMKNHKEFWNYYSMNCDNVLMDKDSASSFIYNYFKEGSKLYTIDTWANSMSEFIQMRNVHTVNVFFIGTFLQRKIDKDIAIKSEVSSQYPFSYIWYLLCLAHDMGYMYEKYSKVYLEFPNRYYYRHGKRHGAMYSQMFRTRQCWYREHGIDITYLTPQFGTNSKIAYYSRNAMHRLGCNIEYNNGIIIKNPRYCEKIRNNYFYYRLYEMKVLDHGIVGADEFFSNLVVNYVKEYRVMAAGDSFRETVNEFHNERGIHFCSEQIKIFAYIADCIASHNMYMAKDNDESKTMYLNYALNCLLPDKFERISYKDNPLLFILCVADTIEPSKKFTNYRNKDVLNLISIDYCVSNNLLNVEVDEELYNSDAGREYVSNIKELEKWCDIKTSISFNKFGEHK